MKTQIVSTFLCLLMGLGAAQAQLKIDFNVTNGAVEPGYQGYFATDKNLATFTAQSYQAFNTTVTIKPTWASNVVAACVRMIDRGVTDVPEAPALLRDWIGTDTRAAGDPMTLTISGLPAGAFQWVSYHHDRNDQTGVFKVTVTDAAGSATTADIDISNGTNFKLADVTKFTTRITSNGKTDVTLVFDQTSASSTVTNAIFVMNAFELASLDTGAALAPVPDNQATDVHRDGTILSWMANKNAVAHGVYLGTDYDDIDDGTTASAVYRGRQDANSFDPGRLELGKTYFWRVDEITSDRTAKGDIWSFTVEPVSIQLAASQITATASSSQSTDMLPGKTIDGSGINASDQHSILDTTMWLSNIAGPQPTWIQYAFDKVYKFHQMWVWNSNQSLEAIFGFGAKDVTVEYSTDPNISWTPLAGVSQFARATGTANYVHNTTVDFGGVSAKYVRITIKNNWGGILPQYGLSEVRFYQIPVRARLPQPASAATNVALGTTLSWRPGREAARHEVYLGTDPNVVRDATIPVKTVTKASCSLASLAPEYGKTYYWKVNEVNDSATPTSWNGDVWSFSTPAYATVDDFEAYNDNCNRIFFAWVDGYGHSGSVDCGVAPSVGNGTGSAVGNMNPPFAEPTIIHSGRQSMPMAYDNTGKSSSEAIRTFAVPQDWTVYGIKALVLWFCGNPTNTASKMYVKVNGRKVAYDGDADNLLRKPWHLWYIPLSQFTGVDLSKVTGLAIGLEGGKGLVFFDDIALSPLDQQSVTPVKPDAANLVAYYTMDDNANDSAGGPAGTFGGAPTFVPGKSGQAIKLNGAADYVLVTRSLNLPVYSAALWFRVEGGTGNRALLAIFNDAAQFGTLLEVSGAGGLRFLHRTPVGGVTTGDVNIRNNGKFDDGVWYHAAIVKSADSATLYINGEQAGSAASTTQFDQALTKIALGMLKYPIDTADTRYFPGEIDEVYLYSRALSHAEIAWLAGLTKPVAK